MRWSDTATASIAVLLVRALPLIAAHEDVGSMHMGEDSAMAMSSGALPDPAASYFQHPQYVGWMYAHAAVVFAAWVVVMPVAIMLSVARSRYHIPAQVFFHIVNGFAVCTGFVYNHATPDLYKGNSHHSIGWVVTSFSLAWTVVSLFVAYSEHKGKVTYVSSARVSGEHMHFYPQYTDDTSVRSSRDSGQGTERNSVSLMGSRQGSQDSITFKPVELEAAARENECGDNDDPGSVKLGLLGNSRLDCLVSRNIHRLATPRASKAVHFLQIVMEKLLLLLGFLAITTGFIVYGGIFREREIFSGLAHFIKGGIFFWYGLLSLGRWMGAFSAFGWAWNLRPNYPSIPRWKTRVPSAEFVESFVIWLYGASNVFLEHLNNAGGEWSAQDFEHVSITLLFFGGGLLGMMVESSWARELMNTTVEVQLQKSEVQSEAASGAASDELWSRTYRVPLNPLPGLVIMLLGVMMSSHHQSSMVSTMMHAQWGTLFCGFAMARAATYMILYVRPPTSRFPARPPSELIASFCLVAGGLMFMFSARDVVVSIEVNGLDAMTIFTVTMGFAGLVMAWEILVYAIKGWAVRKERTAAGQS